MGSEKRDSFHLSGQRTIGVNQLVIGSDKNDLACTVFSNMQRATLESQHIGPVAELCRSFNRIVCA